MDEPKQIGHAADWVPCSRFIPPDDPEWSSHRHYSITVLVWYRHGSVGIAHTYQYEEDERLQWVTSDSEGCDVTDDVLAWRSLPTPPSEAMIEGWRKMGLIR